MVYCYLNVKLRVSVKKDYLTRLSLSYLKNHTQIIKIGSTFSDWTNVKIIPQSSILDPLSFNIIINYLFFFLLKCEIYYFADNNSLYSCGMNLDNMYMNGLYENKS